MPTGEPVWSSAGGPTLPSAQRTDVDVDAHLVGNILTLQLRDQEHTTAMTLINGAEILDKDDSNKFQIKFGYVTNT